MNNAWMVITGAAMVGWLVVEVTVNAAIKRSPPALMNVLGAVAFGLIAAWIAQ